MAEVVGHDEQTGARPEDHRFQLVASALCLDFVNTVGDRSGTWRYVRNYLQRYEDVVAWGAQARVLTPREATALLALAAQRPDAAAAPLMRDEDVRQQGQGPPPSRHAAPHRPQPLAARAATPLETCSVT